MQRRRLTGKQPPLNRPNPAQVTRRLTGKQPVRQRPTEYTVYPESEFRRFVPPERLEQVKQVFEELNRPGISRLKTALRARGINASDAEIESVVRGDESRQVFAPRQRYEGRIASSNLNERWAADLIDFTAQPSPPYTHILVAQDIFSRMVYARPLRGTTPQESTAAFRNILTTAPATPKELSTDQGNETSSTE